MTSLFDRMKNMWEMSAYKPAHPSDGKKYPEYPVGTEVSMVIKEPPKRQQPKDVFFARNKRDPIKDLVNESPHE